ncbi:MAG TPA: hypothetical protein VM284_04280 [Candidatus Limnocylindria bacterium]|nr:hypothetical protein [Candidatus Limnocylindria bacterium]
MGAPAAPHSAEKPRTLRLHLWWTMVLVLAALGGAGLAVAADRPGNPVQRPELTYRADQAAQPWVDHLFGDLGLVHDDGTELSAAGRDVLGSLSSLDLDGTNAALAGGDETSAGIATLVAGLQDTVGRAHQAVDMWRLGPLWSDVFNQIDAAIAAADELPADWTAISATGRLVAGLVEALRVHDAAVFEATTAGRDGRWADAIALLNGAAADALAIAAGARDQLAAVSPVDTLDDLLGRERAYDAALLGLYQYLADGGPSSGNQFDALKQQVDTTQTALPSDNGALVVIVGEAAGLPIADQLLAMEKVHGTVNDALEAITDARNGGPTSDGTPDETPEPGATVAP